MPLALSAYLELVRFSAALVVFMAHGWGFLIPDYPLPWPGHQAVVVFFVLSGYVIAHATSTKEGTLRFYLLARASRLLSVTVPALLLSGIIALLLGENPADIIGATVVNGLFLAQSWGLNVMAPVNAPYWSLCYEAWYYAIFAAAQFFSGPLRWVAVAAACVAAGPRILVLMPCWLLGVVIYRTQPKISGRSAAYLFAATVIAYLAYFWFDVGISLREAMRSLAPPLTVLLEGSNQVLGDSILAVIVAANFVAVGNARGAVAAALSRCRRSFSFFASFTLSLYLYHYPLIIGAKALGLAGILPILGIVAICFALSRVTETRRNAWRAGLARIGTLLRSAWAFGWSG